MKMLLPGCILVFFLLVRLYQITVIPSEWYGDISNVHEYVSQIVKREWPFYFFQSPGPLYHYLIAPIALLFSQHGYETYKIASIVVSFLGLWGTYLFVSAAVSKKLALITTLIMSASFWFLVWSRLGNSQIIIPSLVSFLCYFFTLYHKKQRFRYIVMATFAASFGWYAYPQTFMLAPVLLLIFPLYLVLEKKFRKNWHQLLMVIILSIILILPFLAIVKKQPDNFGSSGYVGQKFLPAFQLSPADFMKSMTMRFVKVAGSLHIKGDDIFRSNIPGQPHLDRLSGIFFLFGIVYFLCKKRCKLLVFIGVFLIVLPLPSIFPAVLEGEIPSSSRTIGITPFVYTLTAAGIVFIYEMFDKSIREKTIVLFCVCFIFGMMIFFNLTTYFAAYPQVLPDKNLGPGRIIATYVDKHIPQNVGVYFSSCCWGAWGEPEPKGVAYVLRKKRYVFYNRPIESCDEIKDLPAFLVSSPADISSLMKFRSCGQSEYTLDKIVSDTGTVVANTLYIK